MISLVCLLIALYATFEARNIVRGPIISVEQPVNGATTISPLIEVRGRAKNISSIFLNDRPITVDEAGLFSEEITLGSGLNVVKVAGRDRFGREKEILVEIIRKDRNELVRK